jgi:hypothetical protein
VGNLAETLLQKGVDIIEGFVTGYVGAYVAVGKFFLDLGGKIVDAVGALGSTLYNKGKDVLDGMFDGIKAKWEDIKSWAGGLGGKIAAEIGDLGSKLAQKGRDLIQGLIDGIKSKLDGLPGVIKDAIGFSVVASNGAIPDWTRPLPSRSAYRMYAPAPAPQVNLVRVSIAGHEVRAVISDEAAFNREITARDQLVERLVGVG